MAEKIEKHHYNISWVVFAVVLGLIIVAFLYFKYQVPADQQAIEEAREEIVDTEVAAERDAVLSPIQDSSEGASAVSNPLDAVPSINPIDIINPFQALKTNPFE